MKKLILFLTTIIILTACANYSLKKEVIQNDGYSNSKIQWGFKKNKHSSPEIPARWKELLRRFDGYFIGDENKKSLFLTFDEGYENGYTPAILDALKEHGVPAAFFITGAYVEKEKDLVKRMVNEGHIVGNHTLNHPSMPEVARDEKLIFEIEELSKKFYSLTGKTMKYLRPPKGEFSERTLALSQKKGYKTILWSSAFKDWIDGQNSKEEVFKSVTEYLHNGAIILMHAVSRENAQALPEIIKYAQSQGYTFESLDDL